MRPDIAAVCARLVGILRIGRESPPYLLAGGMDSQTYPGMLLDAVARTKRESAQAAKPWVAGTHARGGAELPGSLAFGSDR